MKILYVTDSYPPILNGVSYVVEHLARHMAAKGHEVEVATVDSSWRLPKVEDMDGVLVRRFPGFSPGRSYHFPSPKMLQNLKKEFDVIHVHNFHSVLPLLCSMYVKNSRYKGLLVATPHYHTSGHHMHSRVAWLLYKPLLQNAVKRFDAVHCVSCFEAERVARDFGVRPIVIENGVDEDVYYYSWIGCNKDAFNITCVGRLERYKRIDWVIRAASIVMEKGYKVRVNVIGSGPEASLIIRLAQRLGVDLKLMKPLPRDTYLRLLSESSCVVNPSSYEAFSIVCAEALAMGVPVIVMHPWGINFKNYQRAIIVNPDVPSIADGILESKGLGRKPIRPVPTWNEVTEKIYREIYMLHKVL
jgi:glycosyltransferase involved in cell wall biosynthesis